MKFKILLSFGLALVFVITIFFNGSEAPLESKSSQQQSLIGSSKPIKSVGASATAKAGSDRVQQQVDPKKNINTQRPKELSNSSKDRPQNVTLWTQDQLSEPTVIDGIQTLEFTFNTLILETLHVGQTLTFALPTSAGEVEAVLKDTHNAPGGTHIWNGNLEGQQNKSSVIIAKGKLQTHITVTGKEGAFSVVIDNDTGYSTFVDEGTIHEGMAPFDDGIVFKPDNAH